MALSRKLLKALLAEHENRDEIIDEIIDAHAEVVAGLKAELASFEEAHTEFERCQAEILRLKEAGGGDMEWKEKFDALNREYEALKREQDEKDAYQAKAKAFREMLRSEGIKSTRLLDMAVRGGKEFVARVELSDGAVKNQETMLAIIRNEFADLLPHR